jgi:hypothetical protein
MYPLGGIGGDDPPLLGPSSDADEGCFFSSCR